MPSFDVVSVRPSQQGEGFKGGSTTVAAYRRERIPLSEVLSYAFGMAYEQELVNAPSWVTSEPFDIQARLNDDQIAALGKLSRDDREEQMRLMMQSMLAERFHLTYHFETRQLPLYQLEVAKGGLKCPADPDAPQAIPDLSRPRFRWSAAPSPPPPPRGEAAPAPQPLMHMRTRGWPWWLLVTMISHQPELEGRPVVDRTGIDGAYDCQLTWSHGGGDEPGDYLFTALQKQLGLKLQPAKGPVEVLVIDRVEKPTEN
jgi:uncharacterized protein (TIGR03435 family)